MANEKISLTATLTFIKIEICLFRGVKIKRKINLRLKQGWEGGDINKVPYFGYFYDTPTRFGKRGKNWDKVT